MNVLSDWSFLVSWLALGIPATFALAAVAPSPVAFPRGAILASAIAFGLALLLVGAVVAGGGSPRGHATLGVQVDAVTMVMLVLVCGIGGAIVRYSMTYLHGDPGLARYTCWLLVTLSAVTSLVVARNLLVIVMAWTATSLALHQLLTFHSERPPALVAAHKKFLLSRLADVCLGGCLVLVHLNVQSFELDRIASWARAQPELTPSMHVAAILVVVAVAMKSAQLPFHGWLTQVMEAPTPVSALLHAGVVNMGGFVLIRLSPWMTHASFARWILVVVGLVTAVVAALIMTTRVSVKVALAWSTCAQMGFMLVQCGLGAWHLALLHLVAHSLYKAHAFLSAGSAVDEWRLRAMTKRSLPPSWARLGVASALAIACGALFVVVLPPALHVTREEAPFVPALPILIGLSMVPLFARPRLGIRSTVALVGRAFGVATLSIAWHVAAARVMPPVDVVGPDAWAGALVGLALLGLFTAKTMLAMRPGGKFARSVYPWLFAGLYLDERFTRWTFRLWPPRLPPSDVPRPVYVPEAQEA